MNRKARDRNSEQSLCEKSMEMVANIIKLSSFSVAQMTLGVTSTKSTVVRDYAPVAGSNTVPEDSALLFQPQERKKSQEPQSRRQNPVYVTEPTKTNGSGSSHVIHRERTDEKQTCKVEGVDGLADEYISKVRKQLGFEFNKKSKLSSYALVSRPLVK